MRITKKAVKDPGPRQRVGVSLMIVVLLLSVGAAYAQEEQKPQYLKDQEALRDCASNFGYDACLGLPHGPIPDAVNDLWNAIAYSPLHNIAAFAGSFTAPENAKAAALKGCAALASDCRIVVAAHDMCIAVAYERKAGGAYRSATGKSKQDAQGNALPVCVAQGPQHCRVLARCSGQPPQLFVSE